VTNASNELNHIIQEMSEEQLTNALYDYGDELFSEQGIFDFEEEDDDDDDNNGSSDNDIHGNNILEIENSFYLSDINEFDKRDDFNRELGDINVEEHGDPDYDIDEIIRNSEI
jgi:hypothetical protein